MTEHLHLDEESLFEYLDGELPADRRRAIEGDLAGCETCRAALTAVRSLYEEIEALPQETLQVDLAPRVLAELKPAGRLKTYLGWVAVFQALLAPAILLAAIPALLGADFSLPQEIIELDGFLELSRQFPGEAGRFIENIFPPLDITAIPGDLLYILTPLLISTGLLWVVGNSIIFRNLLPRNR